METIINLSGMFDSYLSNLDSVKPYAGSFFKDYCISGLVSLCMSMDIDVTVDVYDLMQLCYERRYM